MQAAASRAEDGEPLKPVDVEGQELDVVAKTVFDADQMVACFIKKVYSILSLQLLLTTAMGATFMFVESAQQFAPRARACSPPATCCPGFLIALHVIRTPTPST